MQFFKTREYEATVDIVSRLLSGMNKLLTTFL